MSKCCEQELKKAQAKKPRLSDGYAQEGDLFECPKCHTVLVHICDEAEGCYWTETSDHR